MVSLLFPPPSLFQWECVFFFSRRSVWARFNGRSIFRESVTFNLSTKIFSIVASSSFHFWIYDLLNNSSGTATGGGGVNSSGTTTAVLPALFLTVFFGLVEESIADNHLSMISVLQYLGFRSL
jgi:hypothetical protein